MTPDFPAIFSQFPMPGTFLDARPFGSGHINDTYLVRLAEPHGEMVLQRINHHVFRDPVRLMLNIQHVTDHLRAKAVAEGRDPARATLRFLPTRTGESAHHAPDGTWWRMCPRIQGARTYDQATHRSQILCGARAFGRFQREMSDFPADQLAETIPDFHHTPRRVEAFRHAVSDGIAQRRAEVQEEIAFVEARAARTTRIVDLLGTPELPLRVTHNDTKFNNVMIDDVTGDAVCVIDLDTVMPGSALYDFGDAIRGGASEAAEDETDLNRVRLHLPTYEAFVEGYLDAARDFLTPTERELMPFSAWLMTLECGIRFLTDHLNGDVYFKIHRPGHNLDRARNQFQLALDMERHMTYMAAVIPSLTRLRG